MPVSKDEANRLIWQCVIACKNGKKSYKEKQFMEALSNSPSLGKQLARAKLAPQDVDGFISTVLALDMDYDFFQSRLNHAKRLQAKVRETAATLTEWLMKLEQNPLTTSVLRYQHEFLQSSGINATMEGALDALTPLSRLTNCITEISKNRIPDEEGFIKAALYSRKNSSKFKPQQYAAALLECMPKDLNTSLCPAIATVVNLRFNVNISSTEVRRILKHSTKNNHIECLAKP
jgi:hypothetical protein